MTYKELVDTLRQIAFNHQMIVDFGYGELSDIKVKTQDNQADNDEADYPYMFLNPGQHTRTQNSITYSFNLIMMDMAKDDDTNSDVVRIQSECQQYIDDVLAELYFENDNLDVELVVTLTPFKERFQDNVAGMTASLDIVVPRGLNRCIAPFIPESDEVVYVTHLTSQVVDPDSGVPFGDVFAFGNTILTDGGWGYNRYTTQAAGTYKFVMEYSFQYAAVGDVYGKPILSYRVSGQPAVNIEATGSWPSNPQPGVTYTVTQTWDSVALDTEGSLSFMQVSNTPQDEVAMNVDANASLKIYKYN